MNASRGTTISRRSGRGRGARTSRSQAGRRSRPWLWLLPLLAGLGVSTIIARMPVADRAFAAAADLLGDPSAVLARRSPGARGDGPLMSTKPAGSARDAGWGAPAPTISDAPTVLTPPDDLAPPDPAAFLAQAVPPFADMILPLPEGSVPAIADDRRAGGGGAPWRPLPWLPWGPPIVVTPAPPPGIPEPASWLLAIIGFLGAGAAMRHGGAARRAARG